MKNALLLPVVLLALTLGCKGPSVTERSYKAGAMLDDFHDAASKADSERYFGHFAADGVFLGTDATERWTVTEFKAYAEPRFATGTGWTYHPRERHVMVSVDGDYAWFDEKLNNATYGDARGTGVLRRENGEYKIVQYNLTLPIPNDVAGRCVEIIQGYLAGSRE